MKIIDKNQAWYRPDVVLTMLFAATVIIMLEEDLKFYPGTKNKYLRSLIVVAICALAFVFINSMTKSQDLFLKEIELVNAQFNVDD